MTRVKVFASQVDAQRHHDAVQTLLGLPSRTVTARGGRCPAEPFGASRVYYEPRLRNADLQYEVVVPQELDGQSITLRDQLVTMDYASAVAPTTGVTTLNQFYTKPFSAVSPNIITHHIGNSLTFTAYGSLWRHVEAWAGNMGYRVAMGGQYWSSQTLPNIYANPDSWSDSGNLEPWPDKWSAYLPTADLSFLSLQIYRNDALPTTLDDDVAAAVGIINTANSVGKVLLYVPWYLKVEPEWWTSVVGVTGSTNTRHSAEYATAWLAAMRAAMPNQQFAVYPCGEIMHQMLAAGWTADELYSDHIHANALSGWANKAGMLATILGVPATSLDWTKMIDATYEPLISEAFATAALPVVESALALWR